MNEIANPSRILPVVAAETARYLLRRHFPLFLVVSGATLLALILIAFDQGEHTSLIIIAAIGFYAPVITSLLFTGGIVSDERASGLIVMWFQKPGSLFRAYLIRHLLSQVFLIAFTVCLIAIVLLMAILAGGFQTTVLRMSLAMLGLAMLPGAMVFALSAWGVRRDSTVAVILILVSLTLSVAAVSNQSTAGRIIKTAAFPIDQLMALFGAAAYPTGTLGPFLTIVAHIAGWTCLGLIGLRYTEHAFQNGKQA